MPTTHKKTEEKPVEAPVTEEVATEEPVVVSDVVTETIVIEDSPVETPEVPENPEAFPGDPLSTFKERVNSELNMPDSTGNKNYMWPILLIFAVAIVLLIGLFAYRKGAFNRVATVVNKASATPTPAATPVPTATPDLTKFEIEILNGSTVTGEASKEKAVLAAAGYTVSSVGNADNSDYTTTIIKAQSQVDSGFIAELKTTLSNTYTLGDTQVLSSSAAVPVQVILGTEK